MIAMLTRDDSSRDPIWLLATCKIYHNQAEGTTQFGLYGLLGWWAFAVLLASAQQQVLNDGDLLGLKFAMQKDLERYDGDKLQVHDNHANEV